MPFVPGWLVCLVTFPGVIVHEMAHQLFCRFFRVAVFDVCYFRVGNPAGYVTHEKPLYPYQQVVIAVGPFLINTLLGIVIAGASSIPCIMFREGNSLDVLLCWLGVSIAMHAFPSTGDAETVVEMLKEDRVSPLLKIISWPLVGLVYLGAVGSVFWLDLLYGVVAVMAAPNLLLTHMSDIADHETTEAAYYAQSRPAVSYEEYVQEPQDAAATVNPAANPVIITASEPLPLPGKPRAMTNAAKQQPAEPALGGEHLMDEVSRELSKLTPAPDSAVDVDDAVRALRSARSQTPVLPQAYPPPAGVGSGAANESSGMAAVRAAEADLKSQVRVEAPVQKRREKASGSR